LIFALFLPFFFFFGLPVSLFKAEAVLVHMGVAPFDGIIGFFPLFCLGCIWGFGLASGGFCVEFALDGAGGMVE
jgi:hypothetical protein